VTRRQLTLVVSIAFLISAHAAASAPLVNGALTPPDATSLARDVNVLADPAMEGRGSGTPGGERAAREISRQLELAGLHPGGDAGTFFQSFVVATGTRIAATSRFDGLGHDTPRLELDRDWRPHGGSRAGEVTGDVVFVGHGIVSADGQWNDYDGVDMRGRIALALDGAPSQLGSRVASRLDKVIAARRAGASALLIASDRLATAGATSAPVAITSASITRSAADALLTPSGESVSRLETAIASRRAPMSFAIAGQRARIDVVLEREEKRAANVIGILPGRDPALRDEIVIVGAHYDHLGVRDGKMYPGADDNASGTAVVLGLARAFAAAGSLPRTIVFALFSGEELGLLGSRHYVSAPTMPIGRTVAMMNLDMVGRLGSGELTIGGVDSGNGLRQVVADAAHATGVRVRERGEPFSPSDHLQFYRAGMPILFFHTGSHADYHKPTDTADRIDADGMARVAAVATDVLARLASGPVASYVKLTPPARERGRAPRSTPSGSGAFLGIIADPHGSADGVRLSDVVPGSAADRAGVRGGDVIVRIGGEPVNGFDELRKLIETKKPGDTVDVVYLRDGEDRRTSTALDARP
jgi:peptidase M28-like protein/PDZ domain-containing protein/PA domain-containing protein